MEITSAKFIISNTNPEQCPSPVKPEYAFIGRSNVGKSSLINMLTMRKKLAKTSVKPGKTRLINHFLINDSWYLVDLPGYGYAKVSKSDRKKWLTVIYNYLEKRSNLVCLFVLLDARLAPQKNDLEFMEWLSVKKIPFAMVFTKSDKLSNMQLNKNLMNYEKEMLQTWEEIPRYFVTSATKKTGREEMLATINALNSHY